jgi:hypothetical protein
MANGQAIARSMLVAGVVQAARELRDATREESSEAWVALDEALTALDDYTAMSISNLDADAKVGTSVDIGVEKRRNRTW